jgi:hypothetical protein
VQTERRHNPYPFTWEIPAATATIALLFAGLWHWPHGRHLFTSIPTILTGHPTAGLTPTPDSAATPGAVLTWICVVELLLLAALGVATWHVLHRWGPGRLHGMASPAEAESTLGLARLRRVRSIIRPDLHPLERRIP